MALDETACLTALVVMERGRVSLSGFLADWLFHRTLFCYRDCTCSINRTGGQARNRGILKIFFAKKNEG